jgi:hypothetical protein
VTLALQYGLFDLDRLERLILRVIAKEYFRLADQEEEWTDEIDQLLRSLHLTKIAAIIDEELAHAKKHQLAYDTFLARLLRAQYQHRQATDAGSGGLAVEDARSHAADQAELSAISIRAGQQHHGGPVSSRCGGRSIPRSW